MICFLESSFTMLQFQNDWDKQTKNISKASCNTSRNITSFLGVKIHVRGLFEWVDFSSTNSTLLYNSTVRMNVFQVTLERDLLVNVIEILVCM